MRRVSAFPAAVLMTVLHAACNPALAAQESPRPASQQEYWAQFDRKDWTAAAIAAEQLVAAARAAPGKDQINLADALCLLGNARLGKGDFVDAEAAFAEALQLVERHSTTASANLLAPLRGLGYALAARGEHEAAVPMLERALLISHRSFGLFDIGQQGLLRQLALSLTQTGRTDEAARHMTYLLRVGERSYGAGDVRMISILMTVADWYADTGNFLAARQLYQAGLQIVGKKSGANSLAAVELLRSYARTYTQELYYSTLWLIAQRDAAAGNSDFGRGEPKTINPRYLNDEGRVALEKALQILDQNSDRSASEHVATLLQMGDWYQVKQDPQKALSFYRKALAIEGTPPEESAQAQLSFPVRVYYPTPHLAARYLFLPAGQAEERFVELEFSVTREGSVKDARIVEENASSRQASEALEAIEASRYRPKFVNGEPVDTPAMTFREVFKSRKKADDKAAAGERSG